MDIKELNKRIGTLAKANAKVEAEIQALGLASLAHLDEHGDTMPLNRLVNALRRTQHKAFVEWALAFGKVLRNTDKGTMEAQPLKFAKDKATDIAAATEKPWFMFGEDKAEAIAKAFDFQAAVASLLRKAAKAGHNHDQLVQLASVAGIPAEKVPATVTTGEPAAQ